VHRTSKRNTFHKITDTPCVLCIVPQIYAVGSFCSLARSLSKCGSATRGNDGVYRAACCLCALGTVYIPYNLVPSNLCTSFCF
jgi:hypothetical protein